MGTPVFIVGAGFSVAANGRYDSSDKQFAKRYPLAVELGIECFGPLWDPAGDVEAAFEAAVLKGNREPVAKLVKLIQTADYFLGSAEAKDSRSIYGHLLERFPGAQFVSFNYDSLLEQVLLHRNLWNPRDGFGVAVETGNSAAESQFGKSKSVVVHLHGSVLLYAVEFSWHRGEPYDPTLWMTPRNEPRFIFDPDNLGLCFGPFSRGLPGLGYLSPEQRVIVPVPDKNEALLEEYVQIMFRRARELLRAADPVIAVEYRFAECDRGSFGPLLQTVTQSQKPLWVVGPDANNVSTALGGLYPRLRVHSVQATLEEWAQTGFLGP